MEELLIKMLTKKRAWVKIIEAFIAILLLLGVLLSLIGFSNIPDNNLSNDIYNLESKILFSIQNNDIYREYLLNSSLELPIELSKGNENLQEINEYINENKPSYLNCSTLICNSDENCSLNKNIEKSVFAQSTIISCTLNEFNIRELKIFCWVMY